MNLSMSKFEHLYKNAYKLSMLDAFHNSTLRYNTETFVTNDYQIVQVLVSDAQRDEIVKKALVSISHSFDTLTTYKNVISTIYDIMSDVDAAKLDEYRKICLEKDEFVNYDIDELMFHYILSNFYQLFEMYFEQFVKHKWQKHVKTDAYIDIIEKAKRHFK